MPVFWKRKTTTWSQYYANIDYLSEPSIDLINRFKEEIVTYEDPKTHIAYVHCTHVEKSKGHLLFTLGDRVEIIIKPVKNNGDENILYFIHCEDL